MELAGGIVPRRIRFGEYLVQAARVGAVFFRHTRERAEHAGVAQDADVGWIDVLIRREVDAVAVLPLVGDIGEPTDREQVRRSKKREAVLARQPLAPFDLLGDR